MRFVDPSQVPQQLAYCATRAPNIYYKYQDVIIVYVPGS